MINLTCQFCHLAISKEDIENNQVSGFSENNDAGEIHQKTTGLFHTYCLQNQEKGGKSLSGRTLEKSPGRHLLEFIVITALSVFITTIKMSSPTK